MLAAGNTAALGASGSVVGAATIPAGASQAAIVVTDASGQQVAQIPLSTQQGQVNFSWDGTNGLGQRVAPGTYTLNAIANVGGSTQQVETQIASYVNSISIDPTTNALTLNTDIGPIALADVREVI